MSIRLAVLLLLAGCTCGAEPEPPTPTAEAPAPTSSEPTVRTLDAVAHVCLTDEGTLRAGFATGCLSSSCSRVVSATCAAALEGSTVVVQGQAVVEAWDDGACTKDCQTAVTVCDGLTLDAPDGLELKTAKATRTLERCWKVPPKPAEGAERASP